MVDGHKDSYGDTTRGECSDGSNTLQWFRYTCLICNSILHLPAYVCISSPFAIRRLSVDTDGKF